MTVLWAIALLFQDAARGRLVISFHHEEVIHQRDVFKAQRAVEQRLVLAHLGLNRREQEFLAVRKVPQPACTAGSGLLAWLVSSP
ncbi:hypothetical protein D3C85_1639610 [compost metagenome]